MSKWKPYEKGNPEYERYINSSEWKQIAGERLKKDQYICCVCGATATDVHHLSYENFEHEKLDDLVSLCRRCHDKAEEIYSMPRTRKQNNFMAGMRMDARVLAPIVFEYLKEVRGSDFDSLMELRQPIEDGKAYWEVVTKAVNALCRKRYSTIYLEDRRAMVLNAIENRSVVICLAEIERSIRNATQSELHETVMSMYEVLGKWKSVAEELGLSQSTTQRLRNDDGSSTGPTLRQMVYQHCAMDAIEGIYPDDGFRCLSDLDYQLLNIIAGYSSKMTSLSENAEGTESAEDANLTIQAHLSKLSDICGLEKISCGKTTRGGEPA